MARPRKTKTETKTVSKLDEIMEATPEMELQAMPLNSLSDYEAYNQKARHLNKKVGYCRHPVKQCPIELHPKQKIIFNRNDQPHNPIKVYLSNESIHYEDTLTPGKEYELPICVVDHLYSKGVPKWKWFDNPDGSRETRISHKDPRFSLRSVMR